MTKRYFLSAIRNLWRRKGIALLNVFGLTLGITVFLLITQYVRFETSYDQYYPDKDRIYRIGLEQYQNGELVQASAENYPALGPALLKDFPEVESYARMYNLGAKNNIVVTYEDGLNKIAFKQKRFLYASETFLDLFGYQMVTGDAHSALLEPFKAVLSESTAKKYFGTSNPVGKYLRMQDDVLADVAYEASGCAISLASASMMSDAVTGRTVAATRQSIDDFMAGLSGPETGKLEGELAALGGVRDYPSRIRCATLPWQALRAALDAVQETVTTE